MSGFELNRHKENGLKSKVKGSSRLANYQNVNVNVAKYEIEKTIGKRCREATRESENDEVKNRPEARYVQDWRLSFRLQYH